MQRLGFQLVLFPMFRVWGLIRSVWITLEEIILVIVLLSLGKVYEDG